MQKHVEQATFTFRSAHGMTGAQVRHRSYAGISVRHMQHFNEPGRAWHDLSDADDTFSIVLAELGGQCEARERMNQPAPLDRQRPNHMSYIPADMRTWAYSDNIASVRGLRLSFQRNVLQQRLGTDLDLKRLETPRLMFHDPRILQTARLLAEECDNALPGPSLYGEGLTIALLGACFQLTPEGESQGLAAWQLRRVTEFIHEHLDEAIPLAELAKLTDLSLSQFARLFKASTGVPPHQYQMRVRIERAQQLLLSSRESLPAIAIATGFADQSHLTRVFRKWTGATPSAWKQDRRR